MKAPKLRFVRAPFWLFVVLGCSIATPSAHAANRDSKEKAAKRACLAGDYTKGVAILSDLYADTNDPAYIYNGGRCFEQNGRYEEAILRFREYLRKARRGDEVDEADAERHIADCQALMGKKESDVRPAPAQPEISVSPSPIPAAPLREPQPTPPIPQQATPSTTSVVETTVPGPSSTAGAGLRAGGIAAMVVGGAGLVTGLILNLKANNLANELEQTTDNYQRSKESTRAHYQTLGWISYGVGGACVVGGAILYYLGRMQGNASLVLLPTAGADEAGAMLRGTF